MLDALISKPLHESVRLKHRATVPGRKRPSDRRRQAAVHGQRPQCSVESKSACQVSGITRHIACIACQINDLNDGVNDLEGEVGDLEHEVIDSKREVGDMKRHVIDLERQATDLMRQVDDFTCEVADVACGINDLTREAGDIGVAE